MNFEFSQIDDEDNSLKDSSQCTDEAGILFLLILQDQFSF
jgi:hypothetical protein